MRRKQGTNLFSHWREGEHLGVAEGWIRCFRDSFGFCGVLLLLQVDAIGAVHVLWKVSEENCKIFYIFYIEKARAMRIFHLSLDYLT